MSQRHGAAHVVQLAEERDCQRAVANNGRDDEACDHPDRSELRHKAVSECEPEIPRECGDSCLVETMGGSGRHDDPKPEKHDASNPEERPGGVDRPDLRCAEQRARYGEKDVLAC